MLAFDPVRENFGWIGAAAATLTDPDFDALVSAFPCTGTSVLAGLTMEDGTTPITMEDGTTPVTDEAASTVFGAELVANRAVTNSGATLDAVNFYAYGASLAASGTQYCDVGILAPGFEDFGIRCRVRPTGAGVRNLFGLSNGAAIVRLNAAQQWEVFESSAKTSATVATMGTWYEVALEREGLTFALKVNEVVVVTWTTSFNGIATAVRLGSSDGAAPASANYQDLRVYNKGVTAVRKLNKRPMLSRFRRNIVGVGRV